jgi:HJR/Mrr/RecB family endonuclease
MTLHRLVLASTLPVLVAGLMVGTLFFLVMLLAAAMIGLALTLAICAGIVAFGVGFLLVIFHVEPPKPGTFESQRIAALVEIENLRKSLAQMRAHRTTLLADLQRIKSLLPMRLKYEQENAKLDTFLKELEDRRHRLLLQDWRAMRGVPFEAFLKEVLEVLGFEVATTDVTGDQGIDLIASRSGERLGIQAKGYQESVSNSAVQQAFAGMSHYRCHRCAVITNSEFTRAARELALSTGCILVDQRLVPDLIAGKVFSSLTAETLQTESSLKS